MVVVVVVMVVAAACCSSVCVCARALDAMQCDSLSRELQQVGLGQPHVGHHVGERIITHTPGVPVVM
jgi:hypothetical protein